MVDLLPSAAYPSVRAAIWIGLTDTTLPDATIALDIYAGAAVRDVLAVDPQAETRTGAPLAAAERAAVYFCAARMAEALPQTTEISKDGATIRRRLPDLAARAAALRALASAALDSYLATTPATADIPTLFTTAPGTRGRW